MKILIISHFFSNEVDILIADLKYINLDDVNFDEDKSEAIVQVKLMPWRNRFKQHRTF